jgi:hypothetical protein
LKGYRDWKNQQGPRMDGADALMYSFPPFLHADTTKERERDGRRKEERQLPLGADPSSGEQTFLTKFLLFTFIQLSSLFFFYFSLFGLPEKK